jgi:hypothetical protein
MKLRIIAILISAVAVAGTSWYAIYILTELNDVSLSFHGKLAMTLGIVVTFLVGVGLMALIFYSARHGHDDI